MVSVIISTYNRSKYLKRACESVLAQTYKDWELVIVNDASKDDTKTYIHQFQLKHPDHKIICINLTQNFGSDTKPKNEGIMHSTGEYVAFLDDDNEYMPDHLMVLTQEAKKRPDADVIYGDRMVVADDFEQEPQIGIASDFSSALLVDRNYIDTSDVLVKRSALYTVGGFDERYEKYVDWNLWVRMAKAGMTFVHVPKVISYYHLHTGMKSTRVRTSKERVGKTPFGNINPKPVFRPEWEFFELEIKLPYLGDHDLPKVAIYTLTMDRLDYTKRMYTSLKKAGYPFDWFVVDNGSTDGTVQWLKRLKNVQVIFNKKNKGISIGSNQALDAIGDDYDYIIKIDNDCELLSNDWLVRLLDTMKAHWMLVLSPYVEGLVDNPGGVSRITYKNLRGHMLGVVPHLGGIFTLTHKNAYNGFRWDTDDFLHGMQDTVFSQEMQKRDYLLAYVEDMRCLHIDSTTGQKEKYPDYFERRRYEKTHAYENTRAVQKR